MTVRKIMFVCLGNICRSPLAQAVFEHQLEEAGLGEAFKAQSSGMGAWHVGEEADPRARRTATRHGVRINHRARQFTTADFASYDLILAMDRQNQHELMRLANTPEHREKVRLFRDFDPLGRGQEVPDPYYGGDEGFEEVFAITERTSRALIKALAEPAKDSL